MFNSIKERIHKDTVLAVPSTDYPFHIHVDSANVGTGCILVQQFPEGKRIISFNSRVFDKAEQKMSTLHRELRRIVSALQTYEHYIIGSPFPIYLYYDHKPILYLWGRKGQLSHRFFRYQVIVTKFQNLKIMLTSGSNVAFPDILSRNVTVEEYKMHQLRHKRIPRDIEFFDDKGTPVSYQNQHEDSPNDTWNYFYPIRYKRGDEEKNYDYKMTAKTLPSVAYLTNSELIQFNKLLTVSEWDDLSTSLEECVDQRINQSYPLTPPILTIVQPTPLVRLEMRQQIQPVTAMPHARSVRTPKMTISFVISVFKLINPNSVKPNKLTNLCLGKPMLP